MGANFPLDACKFYRLITTQQRQLQISQSGYRRGALQQRSDGVFFS